MASSRRNQSVRKAPDAAPTPRRVSLLRRCGAGLRRAALLVATALAGCASTPVNPSFPVTERAGEAELKEMAAAPQPLERPVVVLGGFVDPGFATDEIASVLQSVVSGGPVIKVSFNKCRDFDECRDAVIAAVLEQLPERAATPEGRFETLEVDVVANSMGGLVARYAALWPGELGDGATTAADADGAAHAAAHADTRLRAARILTISSPHRGSPVASAESRNALTRDMAPGSKFIQALDAALPQADYELICYARLGDRIVGVENCAPPGQVAYWVPDPPLEPAHILAFHDRRLLADIARRLRGEAPLAVAPPAPYPTTGG